MRFPRLACELQNLAEGVDRRRLLRRLVPVGNAFPHRGHARTYRACEIDLWVIADVARLMGRHAQSCRRPLEHRSVRLSNALDLRYQNRIEQRANLKRVDRAILDDSPAVCDQADCLATSAKLLERIDRIGKRSTELVIAPPEIVNKLRGESV